MTRDEAITVLQRIKPNPYRGDGKSTTHTVETIALDMAIKSLEKEFCNDAVSKKEVWFMITGGKYADEDYEQFIDRLVKELENMQPVSPTQEWIHVSERLPKQFEYVNCTCHSLIDDREDWVVETCYIPQPHNSPYSDWGNIPMLNSHECEVIAWMYRNIPEPYKAESECEK